MGQVKTTFLALGVGASVLVVAYVVMGLLQRFGAGQMSTADLKRYTVMAGLTLTLVLVALTIV